MKIASPDPGKYCVFSGYATMNLTGNVSPTVTTLSKEIK
jgi:hypothetical protein